MAELTVRSALDAIEDAINRDEKGDALAILQNARDVLTAGVPAQPSLKMRLRKELNGVHMAVDACDSFVHVCNFALKQQGCDIDADVAVVLDETHAKLENARERIQNAIDLLAEVGHG